MPVSFDQIQQGEQIAEWQYQVKREDLVAYAAVSGDGNPIHQDEAFAKSVGLPDVIAHGMHTMGRMGQFVTDWAGDPGALERFKTRFTSMVIVPAGEGNTVTVTGTVAEKLDGNRVRIEVQAATPDGGVAGIGEAVVRLP